MDGISTQAGMVAGSASAPATQVLQSVPAGTLRNNFAGYVGFRFSPNVDITISALSRWCLAANTGTHFIGIWTDAGTLLTSATVDAAPPTSAELVSIACTPVSLTTGTNYRVGSLEVSGGDQWYDSAAYTWDSSVAVSGRVFGTTGAGYPNQSFLAANIAFVPVGFEFTID